jgi:hypothetical protein
MQQRHHLPLVPAFRDNTSFESLPGLDSDSYRQHLPAMDRINYFLARNRGLRRARSLLAV